MKYPIGKLQNKQYFIVGNLIVDDDDSISYETDDKYLSKYLKELVDFGIRLPEDVSDFDAFGNIEYGERDIIVHPNNPDFLEAVEYNLPENYTVLRLSKTEEKHGNYRKTA